LHTVSSPGTFRRFP